MIRVAADLPAIEGGDFQSTSFAADGTDDHGSDDPGEKSAYEPPGNHR